VRRIVAVAQQSLYRRYRPRRFGEIKGQQHVVRALRNAVASESEGHAYLFSGPRGTGKTSTARILAKALNCTNLTDGEPCCECESCVAIENGRSFDLFELDAASNNGVDAVRDLVERSAVSSPGRTKVYILDEVHMLTAAASNALLKTLEEPPEHVRFVLATTDPQKVLPTIRSRTQHFEFFLLSADELSEHVRWVAKDAGLEIDDEAVAHAVRQGRGSVRDTLSALDQVVAAGGVLVRSEPVDQLFEAMAGSDPGVAIVAVADAISQGHDPRVLGEAFLSAIRDAFLVSLGVDTPHLVDADRERTSQWAGEVGTPGLTRAMERVGQALVDMRTAADPRVPLEVALVQLTADTSAESAPETRAAPSPAGSARGSVGGAELDEIRSRLDRVESRLRAGSGEASESTESPTEQPARGGDESSGASGTGPAPEPPAPEQPAPEQPTRSRSADPAASQPQRPGRSSARSAPPPPPPRRRGGPGSRSAPAARTAPDGQAGSAQTRPGPSGSEPAGSEPSTPEPPTSQPPTSEPPVSGPPSSGSTSSGPTTQTASGSASLPDRDTIVMAFGDSVVPRLKGVAKAIYSGGRFLAVADGTAVFALDNAPTVQRAERYRSAVEELLAEKVGAPVPIRLVTEADADAYAGGTTPASSPAGDARRAGGSDVAESPADGAEEEELVARVDELEDADVATRGVDKLTEAFPGAELIETEENS
jgi:DNA polymerase-3 subunit gamma/tau